MDRKNSTLLQQYDRLAAVAVLVILLVSLGYLLFEGLGQQSKVMAYDDSLSETQPTEEQCKLEDLTQRATLLEEIQNPKQAKMLLDEVALAPNLFAPEERIHCEACGLPMRETLEVCPFCKHKEDRSTKTREEVVENLDTDADGMTDVWEKLYTLNPEDASDADLDGDNDGFSNLEEFEAKTNPTDPKSHPDYRTRMSVSALTGTRVPLRAINKMDMGKAYVTFVRVNEDGTVGQTPRYALEGNPILATGEKEDAAKYRFVSYTAQEGEAPMKDKKGVATNIKMKYNCSTLLLQRIADGKEITLTFYDKNNPAWPGEPLLERKVTLDIDLIGAKSFTLVEGASFVIPEGSAKGDTFKVVSIDEENGRIRIENVGTKKSFFLTTPKEGEKKSKE